MNLRELEAQAEFLAPVIAAAVAKAIAPLRGQIEERDQQIADLVKRMDELPAPIEPDLEAIAALVILPEVKDGKDAEPVDLEALAKAAAEFIELPKVDLALLAAEAAALVVMPEPIPGKDADPVDLQAVARSAAALIEVPKPIEPDLEAIAKLVVLPEPIPGKDADPVDLQALARSAAELIHVPEVKQPEDGRDAIDLEILPAIDETKQYARGTYASHRGGLWKSYERTNGLRGWECIVDGIDAVSVTQDAVREFSVTLVKSSGAEVVQKFALPIQVYKGVYHDDEEYEANDTVTWGGSQWCSTKAANAEKPGTGDGWILIVKAGRNGKDLRENASTFDPSKGVSIK